jgi:hypothetical protein
VDGRSGIPGDRRFPTAAFWTYTAMLLAGVAFCFRTEVVIAVIVGVTLYRAGQSRGNPRVAFGFDP